MTELERKLAEALRTEAEEVQPSPDAWAAHRQRVRKRGRRRTLGNVVVVFSVAAVLVLLAIPFLRLTARRESDTPVANAPPVLLERPDSPVLVTRFDRDGQQWGLYFQVSVKGVLGTAEFCLDQKPIDSADLKVPGPRFPGCVAGTLPAPGLMSPPSNRFNYYGKWIYLYSSQVAELKVTAKNGDDLPVTDVARGPDYVLATVPVDNDNPPESYETRDEHGKSIAGGSLP